MLENLKAKYNKSTDTDKLFTIERKIKNYNCEIDNLVTSLKQPNISSSLIQLIDNKILKLDELIENLKKEKNQIINDTSYFKKNKTQLDTIAMTLSDLKGNFKKLNIYSKRELIRLLIKRIEWDNENLDIFINDK